MSETDFEEIRKQLASECPKCGGNGRVDMLEHCDMCGGSGFSAAEMWRLLRVQSAELTALQERCERAERTLNDAGMCIRRLLSKVSHKKPKPKMVDEIRGWLSKNGLQGSILRAPPAETAEEETL